MADIFDNFLHLDRDGVRLGFNEPIHLHPSDRAILFDERHPVFICAKAIETSLDGFARLSLDCFVPSIRTMGPEVTAYYQTLLRSITSFERYEAIRHNCIWDINIFGTNGNYRVALNFAVHQEFDSFLIEDVNRIEGEANKNEDL